MSKENIVEKWSSCRFSLAHGIFAGDEAGYALREEGYNENYSCEHPEIIASGKYPLTQEVYDRDTGTYSTVADLHGIGKFDDPEVSSSLEVSCGNCPFYQKEF